MIKKLLLIIIGLLPLVSYSKPYYGAMISYGLLASEPMSGNLVQAMFKYDPQLLKWRQWDIYFDVGYSHVWANECAHYQQTDIYSIAPIFRYIFTQRGPFLTYLELSIGLAFLTRTRLEDRNLGIHFAFQDRIGVGVFFGPSKAFSIGLKALHYSNASLAEHNNGLTFPLVLDISYRFQ